MTAVFTLMAFVLLAHTAEIVNPLLWNDLADPDVI